MRISLCNGLCVAMIASTMTCAAEVFPERPVRVVVPLTAGSGADGESIRKPNVHENPESGADEAREAHGAPDPRGRRVLHAT